MTNASYTKHKTDSGKLFQDESKQLNEKNVCKLHRHLWHGAQTVLENYIRLTGLLDNAAQTLIEEAIKE